MVRTGWLAALVVALASSPSPAQLFGGMGGGMGGGMRMQPEGEVWTVKFETVDGQSVTGRLRIPSIAVSCSLGLYEIKPGKIKSIEFSPPQANKPIVVTPSGAGCDGTVITESGEKVQGTIQVPQWRVETDLGTLTPDPQHLKTLTLLGQVSGGKKPPGEAARDGVGNPPPLPGKPGGRPTADNAKPGGAVEPPPGK